MAYVIITGHKKTKNINVNTEQKSGEHKQECVLKKSLRICIEQKPTILIFPPTFEPVNFIAISEKKKQQRTL